MPEDSTKYDRLLGFLSLMFFQSVFYAVLFLVPYWCLTLNWTCLSICGLIILLQYAFPSRCEPYCRFITHRLKGHSYFSHTRYYEEQIPQEEKTLFSLQPHSIFTYAMHSSLYHPKYPDDKLSNMVALASRFILHIPVVNIHFRCWGLQSVDPNNMKRLMKEGKTIGMLPGGYEEATLTTPKELRVFIKNRKGFIKYSLKYGYTIRPVLYLNEHQVLQTYDGLKGVRLFLNRFKLPATIFWSSWGIFFPPYQHFNVIIGKGIRRNRTYGPEEDPSTEEINSVHSEYVEAVEALYEKHREKNNGVPLKIY